MMLRKGRTVMNTLEGKLVAKDMKVGIVAARFNEFIVSKLIGGALDGLTRHDVPDDNIIGRMSGRRACLNCGATYHIISSPSFW